MSKDDNNWMQISDMMSVLMMVFLFIAVAYMIDVTKEKDRMQDVASTFSKLQYELYIDLDKEFSEDLPHWGAEIDRKTLSIRFKEPDIMFDRGSDVIKYEFQQILTDFFPRYISVLERNKYRSNIEEVRIEGHTSSEWEINVSPDIAYIHNMRLSQDRTRKVLGYCLNLLHDENRVWVKERLTANGLSSSKTIKESDGTEDYTLSRRVEFRVKTNSEAIIEQILNQNEE